MPRPPAPALVLALALILAVTATAPAAPIPASPELSAAAYERFRALTGAWVGQSTKGWTEQITYKAIAGGSAVLEVSFDAHPDETMVTLIHPDGDRLLLTHYCVARNQPRLVLTTANADASELTFEFLDGTNLPTRDKGHMDKVRFRFADDGTFTSQWTWYQDGKESWMEEIRHARAESVPEGARSRTP